MVTSSSLALSATGAVKVCSAFDGALSACVFDGEGVAGVDEDGFSE